MEKRSAVGWDAIPAIIARLAVAGIASQPTIYTTNAIESVNARLRNITSEWARAALGWKTAMNQFAILYDDRFTRQTR